MALATYVAATPGTRPQFRCGFDIELAHCSGRREPGRDPAARRGCRPRPRSRWAARYADFDEAFVLIRKVERQNQAWRVARARAARARARKGVKNPKIIGRPARDYGRARQVQAFVLQDRSVELVLATGPGGFRSADKVLAQMRRWMAVLTAKAWDLEARPGAV